MIVIGINNLPTSETERRFAGSFRTWLAEARSGRWGNWSELLRHYPRARRIGRDEAHFPLAADDAGIRASITFNPGLMRLLSIAPAPPGHRPIPLSHPNINQPKPHAIIP